MYIIFFFFKSLQKAFFAVQGGGQGAQKFTDCSATFRCFFTPSLKVKLLWIVFHFILASKYQEKITEYNIHKRTLNIYIGRPKEQYYDLKIVS